MLCANSRSIYRLIIAIGLGMLLLAGAQALPASVHAEPVVIRTTPLDGEILQRTPTAVGVGFDVPLDQEQSTFQLLSTDGTAVEGINPKWSANSSSVTIDLPKSFPDGVYTLTWQVVAAEDGTSSQGWSSFSVGNPEDANIITIPTSASGHAGPPAWMDAGARFISLVGIALSLSIWPIWRGVIRPSVNRSRADARSITGTVQQCSWIALGIALAGSLVELGVHSQSLRDASVIDAIMQALGHDEWGFWWIVRMALLVVLGLALAISPWWYASRAKFNDAVLWAISLAMPLPLVLSSHAMDDEVGQATTIAADYLFALCLSLLIGGAFLISVTHRILGRSAVPAALAQMRRRTAWLVISCGAMAIVTGMYLGVIFAGNSDALTETVFGNAMLAQMALAIVAVILAILLLLRPFGKPNTTTLSAALAAVLAISLIATATMDTSPTARAELVERSTQTREDVKFDNRPGILLIAPGRAGVNHARLETPGTYLQTETEVFIELASPDFPELGTKTIQMYRVQGNAFEYHGTEFSLIGNWDITVRIEEPGFPSSAASFSQYIGAENTTVDVPATPWKFGPLAGLAGLSLVGIAVVGIATAVISAGSPLRKEAAGLAGVAVALAVVVILQGRIDPLLIVESGEGAIDPTDMAMVTRGEDLYATYCASCHGPGLRGDGPLAEALIPKPADFSAPHTKVHTNADMIYWIQYGMQGTAMPGFRSQLSDQGIRDVIAFIQYWQQGGETRTASPTVPALGVCEVAPIQFSEIPEIFYHGIHPETRRGTPLVRAGDSNVTPERTNEIMWTLEQMVNCANQDQFLSQVRMFTKPMLQEIFPQGASYEVTSRSTASPSPVAPEDAITIQDVQSVVLLADGRVAVTVIFNDPTGIGVIPGVEPQYQVTLIMVYEDGIWYVDEVR